MAHYDDNFGHYDIEDRDDVDFYLDVQKVTVEKECEQCNRLVMLLPHYSICGVCADSQF